MLGRVIFPGFETSRVQVEDGVDLRVRHGGDGPPVVLLHGHPRTHTTWYRVEPLVVTAGYTVVCPGPARPRAVVDAHRLPGRLSAEGQPAVAPAPRT